MQDLTKLVPTAATSPTEARSDWRPKLHFAPPAHWANDPNALYFDGMRLRLLFQYLDDSPAYRKRCVWAAASSEDLAHWQFEGIVLDAGHECAAYSGCVVQRESRPEEALAFWTEHPATPAVEQRIRSARSTDGGRTFQVEPGLCATRNSPNFRDPFVFWHAESTRWIMLVAEPCNWSTTEGSHRSRLHVYHSLDLQGWIWVSEIRPWDAPSIMWEVPQLVSLDAHGRATCCLIISTVGHSGDASWCSVRYRFGSLGDERFEPYHAEDRWWSIDGRIGGAPPDYVPDFYAAIVSASRAGSIRDSHGLSTIAWMSNWRDARKLSLQNFAGKPMTSPRPLQAFVDVNGNARVRQRATAAVWHSGGKPVVTADTVRIERSFSELAEFATLCFVVEATFDVPSPGSYIELLLVGCDGGGEASILGKLTITEADISLKRDSATDDRTRGGPTRSIVAPRNQSATVKIMILIDQCTSEVFVDDGQVAIRSLFSPLHQRHKRCARYSQGQTKANTARSTAIEAHAVSIRAVE
jgi:sucrose-6-phosphate hydrolase SacC (GH32 family)